LGPRGRRQVQEKSAGNRKCKRIAKRRISLRMVGPPFDLPPCLDTLRLRLSRI
jgi:hypothetical protein